MDDIHTPSVSSGPTSDHKPDSPQGKHVPLLELMGMKQQVEEELSALGGVLDSVCVTCLHTPA